MRRREFIAGLSGAAAAVWPLAGRAQSERQRKIGVLVGYAEDDPEAQVRLAAFVHALHELHWQEGENVRIDVRWSAGDINRASTFAKELVALKPDVILTNTTPVTAAVYEQTRTIPIVFTIVSDPVGSGFVDTIARPGRNATGLVNLESSLVGKWLELLKEIAPGVTQAAVIFNPQTAPYVEYYLRPLQATAPTLGVTPLVQPVHGDAEIENVIAELGRRPNHGVIVMTDSFMFVHRSAVIASTARHHVPAIYYSALCSREGGLISYGVDTVDLFRRAAPYVDRVLRGAQPAELPVQMPEKFEFVINLRAAKALGLTVPPALLATADEVIE